MEYIILFRNKRNEKWRPVYTEENTLHKYTSKQMARQDAIKTRNRYPRTFYFRVVSWPKPIRRN
jgi:hypothetical protein